MSATAQTRLQTDGRFFRLGGRRLFLKAVTYGPFPPEERLDAATEFPRIAAAGFNAIRTYEPPSGDLLDVAHAHGLTVLAGLPWEWTRDFLYHPRFLAEGETTLTRFLKRQRNHPALGAVFVANEIPSDLVRWMGPREVRLALEELIDSCRRAAPEVALAYASFPSTEYLEPRNADFTAFNVYLEHREEFRNYLPRLQNIAGDRPVLLSEFGLDTIRNDEEQQAETLRWHLEETLAAGIAGTTVYAWSDRWATGGIPVDDWAFGLTRRDGSAKPALTALSATLPRIETHRDALPLANPPRISVVVCTFNGAERLKACLAACLAIDFPDFEVLVIDDGSTDRTRAVVAECTGARYIHQDHAGLSAARNRGAREASGEIIAYTDDDCEPDRDWLFWLARAFADPATAAAGGPNLPPVPDGCQEAVVAAAPGAPSHVLLDDTNAEHLPGCNLALRRASLEQAGGFREQFTTAGDDVDLCWRFLDRGWRLTFAPCAFVWHRRRPTLPRFLLQQLRYGRAEALLYEAHPERFSPGGIHWEGCVYTGAPVAVDARSVIYHGPLGDAPYQGIAPASLPRRSLHPDFEGTASRLLLGMAASLQPMCRALGRWKHGGPAPMFRRTGPETKVYRDDLRQTMQLEFEAETPEARRYLLDVLQENG
ncbi:MAG: glycosyltransferase, partial [Akkermansiaceae bacterium]|nr:glycosyltransferase [Akkermansiaceae bacterium]